jgi:acetyl esterase/lipase
VGIMGFSAGGHLASTIATHSKGEVKPDFQILFYPVITMVSGFTHKGSHDNFLGKDLSKKEQKRLEQEFSNDMQVTRATPRAFIALSDDDHGVLPSNGVNYYVECFRHDVPASLHVYPTGGHGWGYRESFPYHMEMLLELKAWLTTF